MINEKIKEFLNSTEEKNQCEIQFRYSDLSRAGQIKLVKLIKAKSSIWTVRDKFRCREIDDAFLLANPVVFANWRNNFSLGQFPRERERELSSLAFNLHKKKISRLTLRNIGEMADRYYDSSIMETILPNRIRIPRPAPPPMPEQPIEDLDNRLDEILRQDEPTTTPITATESLSQHTNTLGRQMGSEIRTGQYVVTDEMREQMREQYIPPLRVYMPPSTEAGMDDLNFKTNN